MLSNPILLRCAMSAPIMMPRLSMAPWTAEFGFSSSAHVAASRKPMM